MRGVMIEGPACGIELCSKIEDKKGTVIYADPPYLVKTDKYLHDFSGADHTKLAEQLCRFRQTRVVVSYYAHEQLGELYPGWMHLDCTRAKGLVQSGKRGSNGRTDAPEVLLINETVLGNATSLFA